MVVGAVVAHHGHFAHGRRSAFANADFQVDRVVGYAHLDRNHVAEQVAVVQVQRRNVVAVGVAVHARSQQLGVVLVAGLDLQNALQRRIVVLGIAQEAHASVVVGAPLFYGKCDANPGLVLDVDAVHGVAHDAGVAESGVVVGLDDEGALAVELFFEVLGGLKNIPPAHAVQLVHRPTELGAAQLLVAFKNNVVDAQARTRFDVEVQHDGLREPGVG